MRSEEPDDQMAIHEVHLASFQTPIEAQIVDSLRDADQLPISLVAVMDGKVLGHVALSPVRLPGAIDGIGLAPVAVLPAHRRRGYADRLIREVLALCRRSNHGFVVVLGDPGYFARFGFVPASR